MASHKAWELGIGDQPLLVKLLVLTNAARANRQDPGTEIYATDPLPGYG